MVSEQKVKCVILPMTIGVKNILVFESQEKVSTTCRKPTTNFYIKVIQKSISISKRNNIKSHAAEHAT